MESRTKKVILVYSMLIMASLCHHGDAQQFVGNTNNAAYPQQANTYHPLSKGYTNQALGGNIDYYYDHPINARYWTGHGSVFSPHAQYIPPTYAPHPQQYYQQYPQYHPQTAPWPQQSMYPQHGYYGMHPQDYGYPMTGYSNQYSSYPNFDANYWHSGVMVHPQMMPVPAYHQQYPGMPYPAAQYPMGHMPVHPGYYDQNAYHPGYPYGMPRTKGFLGGIMKGRMGKTLLGALTVGLVAGTIAKKGK